MSSNLSSETSKTPLAPIWVALAIAIFFPVGFYLLWKHPTLSKNKVWWIGGLAYVVVAMFMAGDRSPSRDDMKRVVNRTLPAAYGEIKAFTWGGLAKPEEPSKTDLEFGWGGKAELSNGDRLFISFFPNGNDYVWLSSLSDGGLMAAGYSDTRYWDSEGRGIDDEDQFWKRAGFSKEKAYEAAKAAASMHGANEDRRRKANEKRFMDAWKDSKEGKR